MQINQVTFSGLPRITANRFLNSGNVVCGELPASLFIQPRCVLVTYSGGSILPDGSLIKGNLPKMHIARLALLHVQYLDVQLIGCERFGKSEIALRIKL